MAKDTRRKQRMRKSAQNRQRVSLQTDSSSDPYSGEGPRVHAVLERFRRHDARRLYGNSHYHQYRLGPPLDEATLVRFESAFGVQIPEDYRSFLKHVGDGGPGPGTGLHALSYPRGSFEEGGLNSLSEVTPWLRRVSGPSKNADEEDAAADHDDSDECDDLYEDDDLNDEGGDDDREAQGGEFSEVPYSEALIAALFPPELADLVAQREENSRFFYEDYQVMARLFAAYASGGEAFRSIDLLQEEYARFAAQGHPFVDRAERVTGDKLIHISNFERAFVFLVISGPVRGSVWSFSRPAGRNAGYIHERIADSFREFYEDFLAQLPGERDSHQTSAGVLDPRKDGERVLQEARATGNDPQVYIDLMMLGQKLNDWAGLLNVLEYVESRSPPSTLLAHIRGNVLTKLGRHAEAVVALRYAMHMDEPHEDMFMDGWFDAPPRLDLSDSLEFLGRFGEALEALSGMPACPEKFARTGRIYVRQGRYEEAIEVCGVARFLANLVENDFAEADALNARGDALRRLGRFPEARRDYERAQFAQDPSPGSRNLAALACNEGRPDEALSYLHRAIVECYTETDYMTDPDFAPARALPGFDRVVARVAWKVPR